MVILAAVDDGAGSTHSAIPCQGFGVDDAGPATNAFGSRLVNSEGIVKNISSSSPVIRLLRHTKYVRPVTGND